MFSLKIKGILESQPDDQDTRGCKLLLQAKIARALLDVVLFRAQLSGKKSLDYDEPGARYADKERPSQIAYSLDKLLEIHDYIQRPDGMLDDLSYISDNADSLTAKIQSEVKRQDFDIGKIRVRIMP